MKKILTMLLLAAAVLTFAGAVPAFAQTAQAASLSKPKMRAIKNKDGSVKISWKTVSNAEGYYVYRRQGSGSYKKIAKVSGGSTASYVDTTVKSGKKYTYCVKAYNGSTKSSAQKSGITTRYLSCPTLSAQAQDGSVKLSWESVSGAAGYKIYKKTSDGSYKKIKTLSDKTSYTDKDVENGTKYNYKMIACYGSYQSATASVSCKPAGSRITSLSTSKNVAISADVTLDGSGTGFHAKLVIGTADAAVSFGLQYDKYAVSPYTGKTAFLVENILSGTYQKYTRFDYNGSSYASLNTTYNLTLVLTKSTGKIRVYVNNTLVGSVTNANLANQDVYVWVEGAARKRGDSVKATFSNVQLIENGAFITSPQVSYIQTAAGLSVNTSVGSYPSKIKVSGTLTSLGSSDDWDSAPDSVNGYIRFY